VNANEIAASLRAEAARLRAQADVLTEVARLLQPRGRPANGTKTPTKPRRQRSGGNRAKAKEVAQAPDAVESSGAEVAQLRVVTGTGPSEREMKDRELVYTTEAPREHGGG